MYLVCFTWMEKVMRSATIPKKGHKFPIVGSFYVQTINSQMYSACNFKIKIENYFNDSILFACLS